MACCFTHLPHLVPHGGWSSWNKHAPHENAHLEPPGGTVSPLAFVRAGQRIARMVQQDVPCSLPEHSENAVRRSAGQATEDHAIPQFRESGPEGIRWCTTCLRWAQRR